MGSRPAPHFPFNSIGETNFGGGGGCDGASDDAVRGPTPDLLRGTASSCWQLAALTAAVVRFARPGRQTLVKQAENKRPEYVSKQCSR
jgi:hypothetical protein